MCMYACVCIPIGNSVIVLMVTEVSGIFNGSQGTEDLFSLLQVMISFMTLYCSKAGSVVN